MRTLRRVLFLVCLSVIFASQGILAQDLTAAVDFKLPDIQGNQITLSSYKGKQHVFLFFWTTWCSFCRGQLKTLPEIYPRLAQDNVELLLIDIGEPRRQVEKAINAYRLGDYHVLLDQAADVASAYGIIGVPTYILINKQGYIVFADNYFPASEYKDLLSQSDLDE